MHGDNDPEIAAFFANFLGEGIRRIPPRPRRDGRIRQSTVDVDTAPIHPNYNGLALGVVGAAELLRDADAPVRPGMRVPQSDRTEAFHQMLEELANDIMENGEPVSVASSREPSPRLSPPTPPPASPRGFTAHGPWYPKRVLPEELDDEEEEPEEEEAPEPEPQEAQDPEEAAEESSEYETDSEEDDDDVSDVVDATNPEDIRYPPTDFGAKNRTYQEPEMPSNDIFVTVVLNTGKTILEKTAIDLDSSLEDLFALVETKTSKPIEVLITRHGIRMERMDISVRWSGLQDGDRITAMYNLHPPAAERSMENFHPAKQATSPNSLAAAKFNKMFPKGEPVAMGAFGDVIAKSAADAKVAGTGPYPSSQFGKSNLPGVRPTIGTSAHDEDLDQGSENEARVAPPRLAENWLGGLELTTAIKTGALNLNLVPPIPPSSEAVDAPPDSGRWGNPVDFDDFSGFSSGIQAEAADNLPQKAQERTPQSLSKSAQPLRSDSPVQPSATPQSLSKSAQPLRTGSSPVQPSAATVAGSATPTSSRLSDLSFAPTPSRKSMPATSPAVDREELKKKMEEKQKANDAIWANIAATLEPVHPELMKEPARRSFLSHTASAGSLKKKLPPMASTRR